ncbi:ABC transporter ATP-binding protein [Vagococcus salmoninarum]|uniref:ABC transporter ATP-binding protein n=1 Tax=Vagococcus salmoninarum TaxID=2739 RepID=UPI0028D28909|nr:ABC transporter ATP-binding protein [Vagococcus salmoninarum]
MKVKHLSKTIDSQEILKDISFSMVPGQINGLVGRNGTGKTTLFRTVVDHYQKDQGSITIADQEIDVKRELYTTIFYLDTQLNPLTTMTPYTIESYYRKLYPSFDTEKFLSLLEKYQLPKRGFYRNYSKGMQGLFNVILAFSTGATYLFFDEPFDGLDIIIKKQVIRLVIDEVSKNQLSLMISSHNLLELEGLVDRALILKDGQIIKNYDLESMRSTSVKVQLAFKEKEIPPLLQESGYILSQQGRVITVLFDELKPELLTAIKALEPVIFEELPISLEDLFASNLTTESDYHFYE